MSAFFQFLFHDRNYYRSIWTLALPLILQNIISASVNLVDSMMIGSLGDVALASVNISNQFYTRFFMILIFGISSGGSILNAQFWGAGDKKSIHHVMGLQLAFCLLLGFFFAVASSVFPAKIIGLYSKDPFVIEIGTKYLSTLTPLFLFHPITMIYTAAFRSIGNPKVPMLTSVISLLSNMLLNYMLIFGHFGAPALGVWGAAIGTLIARVLEFSLLLIITYYGKYPIAARIQDLFAFQKELTQKAFIQILPVVLNEGIWGLGTNVYSSIYAKISTASIAAVSATGPIDGLMYTFFLAFGDACGVLVGHSLGRNDKHTAYTYGKRTIFLSSFVGLILGFSVFLNRGAILGIYKLSPEALSYANTILAILCLSLWMRTVPYIVIIGIMRAGGDVQFSLFADTLTLWFVGIPLALLFAFVFHFPITIVYCSLMVDELLKAIIVLFRFRSKKWMNTLVSTHGI